MLEESSHSGSTNSQKSKKKSIKKAATSFFSKFSSSKNHHDAPVQREFPKKLYSESDFFLKKKRETDRVSADPIDLKRASSSINIITLSQLNDLDKENLEDPTTDSYFRVQDIEPNSREKSPSKHLAFRRPVTRLVHLSDISRHSDSHINTLDHYRKRPARVAPFSPLYDVMFQDDQLDPGNDTNREKSTSAPSSTLNMNMESDHRILGMNSECCESPTGFSSLDICVTSPHKRKDVLNKNDVYSGPNLSSGAKQDAWLDVSLRPPPKTRPKSKSVNINHNKKPQLVQRWSSSGSSTPSVEYENRNIHKTSEKPPINRTSSTRSTLSINSNVSSRSVFGRSESHKKESKAIVLWQTTVEKLIEKSERINTIGTKFHSTDKIKAMAKFIFGELYSTEKSFHTLLKFTYNNYMKTMEKAVQGRYSLVKASDVHVLFYALPEMMGVSEKLLAYLKGYMDGVVYQDCTPGMALGHIFKLLENDMVAFLKYATHHKTNIKSMRKARNSGFITKIENQLQLQKANNRLDLADYLIAPFQRVPRYGLLIKDLLKYTDTAIKVHVNSHETRIHPLLEAQNIIDGLAITMNQVQQRHTRKPSGLYSFTSPSTTDLEARI